MNRIALGMLCFSRPLHTALTMAFALHNKSDITDFFAFYGIHKAQTPPNNCLDGMLKELQAIGGFQYYNMGDHQPRNVQGNVDTLMSTLSSMGGYSCFAKIDDDVIIGRGTEVTMANILLALESENVYMLMGQAVPEHMRRHNPFCWEAQVNGHRVVQRAQKACPMETYTFVSMKCLQRLREKGMDVSCENARGTYGPFTRKIVNAGGKVCLVLTPAIQMQHIGLTTTIEVGNPARSWAPARSWEPMDEAIKVPGFDFDGWERGHADGEKLKQFTLDTIESLKPTVKTEYLPHLNVMTAWVEKYNPKEQTGASADFLKDRANAVQAAQPVQVVRNLNAPGTVLRKLPDGRVVRSPGPVRRVVIRTTA
jgi:hypothetical protein